MAVCWDHGGYPSSSCPGCQDVAEEKLHQIEELTDHPYQDEMQTLIEIREIVRMGEKELWRKYGR